MDSASSEQDEVKSVSRLRSPDRAYDANGNTLSDPSGKSYTWDFENRLSQAVVPGANGGTTTFKYDSFGRRIQKSGPLGTTNYLYDGKVLLEEVDNSGNVLARYSQGPDIDEPLAELRSGTTSYYQQDGLSSVTSLSSSTGALASTYSYDAFGKLSASTGTLANSFQFTGREFDPETGIYEYRARYSPLLMGCPYVAAINPHRHGSIRQLLLVLFRLGSHRIQRSLFAQVRLHFFGDSLQMFPHRFVIARLAHR